jgi:dynein heavy chain
LEITKNDIITRISKDKSTITELENEILRELSEAKGNLLDNVSLIDTLNSSKIKSDSVKQALE